MVRARPRTGGLYKLPRTSVFPSTEHQRHLWSEMSVQSTKDTKRRHLPQATVCSPYCHLSKDTEVSSALPSDQSANCWHWWNKKFFPSPQRQRLFSHRESVSSWKRVVVETPVVAETAKVVVLRTSLFVCLDRLYRHDSITPMQFSHKTTQVCGWNKNEGRVSGSTWSEEVGQKQEDEYYIYEY